MTRTLSKIGRVLGLPLICLSLSTAPVFAQGVPTVDTRNIAQEIRQLQQMLEDYGIQTDQLDTLLEQLDLVQQQLDKLNETYAALTGATDVVDMLMGGDLDGLLDQEFTDLLGTIQQIQSGDFSGLIGNAAPEVQGRMTQALEDAGFDQDDLSEMASSGNPGAERVATQAGTGAMMSAAAENSYDEAAQSLERVSRLVEMIGDYDELKEAVDHNTRVTAELAIAMTRMWELEAIQTVGAGQSGVVDAATLAEERRYMDFTLPELRGD